MINQIIAYFDLQSKRRGKAEGYAGANLAVFPQYVALVLGIVAQPFLANFQAKGVWDVSIHSLVSWSVFAAVAGLIVFPGVYRKAFDPDQPKFVQWCAIFAAGIGWKALLGAAVKVVGAGG